MADDETVLIVEDEEPLRILYEQELEDEHYKVLLATDGREAIEMAEKHKPDLIVMDVRMPHMDGIEAMGRILSRNNTVPIVINTAYSTYKDNFMSWAADAYVVKSSDLTELKTTIRKILDSATEAGPEAAEQ